MSVLAAMPIQSIITVLFWMTVFVGCVVYLASSARKHPSELAKIGAMTLGFVLTLLATVAGALAWTTSPVWMNTATLAGGVLTVGLAALLLRYPALASRASS